jgi:AraC-like DNA-binding protein
MKQPMLNTFLPRPSLQEYIRKYQVFRFVFARDLDPPPKFHTPRPEHCITFYTRDPQRFSSCEKKKILTYPNCTINGMYDFPIIRYGGYDFWAIKVVLQPTALHRILKLPMHEIGNSYLNAEDVWGNSIISINERLSAMDNLSEMILLIETFIENLVRKGIKASHPLDKASLFMLSQRKSSLPWIADQSCLSVRQFIRKFEERVGVKPTIFSRISRLDRAFRLKNNEPNLDWSSVAISTGYCDYQHMVKDFLEFTSFTPPLFYEKEILSPERSFGLYET